MAKKGKAKGTARGRTQTPNLRLFYGLLALVGVVGIGWIGFSVANQSSANAAIAPIQLTGINTDSLLKQARGVNSGKPEASAQVIVFSDFTCPVCMNYVAMIEPQIRTEFVKTNRIRYTHYDFPLGGEPHRYGFIAARAARCAEDQNAFWEYHDVLFGRQNEWAYAREVPLDIFTDYAGRLNMDKDAFDACLRSDRFADVVTANRVLGERLGVGATPTIFIGGRSYNWSDYDAIKAAIEAELGDTTSQ